MKKLLAVLLCLATAMTMMAGCEKNKNKNTAENTPSITDELTPESTDEVEDLEGEDVPLESESPAPTEPGATAVPTPVPTPAPPVKDSIVPTELLTVGYTTPIDPSKSGLPATYNMPYYVEVDLTNQCVNIFIANETNGKYDFLLNRFICSGGTSDKPTKTGKFVIKTQAQQKAATGQNVKGYSYYFKKYDSYAYYYTRYSNEYMFHSFTFVSSGGVITPKSGAYYNMGNRGSAGCLRMLMGHAKWIYDYIDGGTYCYVTNERKTDSTLRSTLKKYIPPLGYDMTPQWVPGNNSSGLVPVKEVVEKAKAPLTPAAVVTPAPTPAPTAVPTAEPTQAPTEVPTQAPTATAEPTPTPAPTPTPTAAPTAEPTQAPTPTPV